MVPESVAAFVALLLFVAPGIFYELLREYRRPAFEETTFREVSRVALASVALSGLSIALLALVRTRLPLWLPDPVEWAQQGSIYVKSHLRLVARGFAVEIVLALLLAFLIAVYIERLVAAATWVAHRLHIRLGSITKVSAWYMVFRGDVPKCTSPYASVRLNDGTQYQGTVIHYAPDVDQSKREIVLGPPFLRVKRPNADEPAALEAWERVVIPASAIEVLSVIYRPTPTPSKQ